MALLLYLCNSINSVRSCNLRSRECSLRLHKARNNIHACHESRAVWLPRYFSPPRYLDLPYNNTQQDREEESNEIHRLRFDIPFISYETDVFTVFDTGISFLDFDVDPFLGFDRKLIQNIAISENAWSLIEAIAAVEPQSLPKLRNVSILVLGPDPDMETSNSSGWREMPAVDIQHINCDLYDISDKLIAEHPLFGKSRLHHLVFELNQTLGQLTNYLTLFKAWLWHGCHWNSHEPRNSTYEQLWDFHTYLFSEEITECPLWHLPGWCPGHHTKDEMLNWKGCFTIDVKFLVERKCLVELVSSSAIEFDPAGNYEHFDQFKEKKIMDFKMLKASVLGHKPFRSNMY